MQGFTAKGNWINGERSSFILVDIITSKSILLCSNSYNNGFEQIGKFFFNPIALQYGEQLLRNNTETKKLIVIDEIGPFELKNKIWDKPLLAQLTDTNNLMLLIVRNNLVSEVINKYKLNNFIIHELYSKDETIINDIKKELIEE